MNKFYLPFVCFLGFFTWNACWAIDQKPDTAKPEAEIIIKTGQWMNRSTATTAKPSYTLDVFATETSTPDIPLREPGRGLATKSKFHLKSVSINEYRDEDYTVSIPANATLYLSSYFEQRPSFLSNTTRYCVGLEKLKAEPNKKYILVTRFILLGPMSAECNAKIMPPDEYQKQISINAEQTIAGALSRKELSLRYGSPQAAQLTAALISQKTDYQQVYLDAAVDRAQSEIENVDESVLSLGAWLARITSEGGSAKHIGAMSTIAQHAMLKNKPLAKKIQKYLTLPKAAAPEQYQPKPIVPLAEFSLAQLSIIAAQENLKSKHKYELEAAARDIIRSPNSFIMDDFDLAEHTLRQYAQAADEEDIASAIWMCRVLAVSGNLKYLPTLKELKKLALHKKLAKEIDITLLALSKTEAN